MKIHILGICGTFMGGIALIARALGHEVSGSDVNVYPPMSTQLEQQGIQLFEGYKIQHLKPQPDLILIGNTMARGNPAIEYILNEKLAYSSGPEWLSHNLLRQRHVLAVAGTHGKTTTTSLLTWILDQAGLEPGFLVGGVAENFGISARLGQGRYFVIEADEYDTAFFDKRSKFVHYHPDTLIINNLEFDHADIFADLADIQRQVHHLIRTVPAQGRIVVKHDDENIKSTLAMGCWSEVETFAVHAGDWHLSEHDHAYSAFSVTHDQNKVDQVNWPLIGQHNAENALAAIAAANHVGVDPSLACGFLPGFKSVKRRLERLAEVNGITIYDDFAHHPTAIRATLNALRDKVGKERIIAILEPRSNTMKAGVHKDTLGPALEQADRVCLFQPQDIQWDLADSTRMLGEKRSVFDSTDKIIDSVVKYVMPSDHIVIMSNGGFESIHNRLIERLQTL